MNITMICLEALEKIIINKHPSHEVIKEYLEKFEMDAKDRQLFINTIRGVVSNLYQLQFLVNHYLTRKRYKGWLLPLVYLSVYQIYFCDYNVEEVVLEALEIANIKDRASASIVKSLLEGVIDNPLRNINEYDELNRISLKYSYPAWLVAYLLRDYDFNEVEQILKHQHSDFRVFRINYNEITFDELLRYLDENQVEYRIIKKELILIKDYYFHRHLLKQKYLIKSSIKANNIVNEVLAEKPAKVIDLLARSSDTINYLAQMNNKLDLHACEYNEPILRELKNSSMASKAKITYQKISPLSWRTVFEEESFDCVIANVPSSGLGRINSIIDLKYYLNKTSLENIVSYQTELVNSVTPLVRVGGTFIYITDTIIKEENEQLINTFIEENKNFKIITENKVMPAEGIDGYYLCKLRRL